MNKLSKEKRAIGFGMYIIVLLIGSIALPAASLVPGIKRRMKRFCFCVLPWNSLTVYVDDLVFGYLLFDRSVTQA